MEALIEVLKDYFLVWEIVEQVRNLWDELINVEGRDIIIGQRNCYQILFGTYLDIGHFRCPLFSRRPFSRQL